MTNLLFEYSASLFDSILCVYFITKFNHAGFKNNRYWIPAVLVIFAYTVFSDKVLPGFNTISTILFLVLYIIYSLLVSGRNYMRAILSAFTFEVILALLSSLIYLIISLVFNDFDSALQGADNHVRNIYLVLHKVSLFAVSKLILYIFKADNTLDIKNGLLCFGFSLTSIIGLASAMYISAAAESSDVQFVVLVITLAFIAANVFLYVLISQLLKLQENKYKVKLLEDKLELERNRYEESASVWNNIRKIQHDIKQHLTVVNGYIEEGETENCKNYLQKLLPAVDRMGSVIKSENKVLDYMINSKLGNLHDTEIIVSGIIGDLSDIDELDLACLFGNILDNAVEAVQNSNEKRIELLLFKQNSNRIIICKNTINASVLKTNRELKTTKRHSDSHGYGISIVAKIVGKYGGMIEYFEELDMFGVQICIPQKQA